MSAHSGAAVTKPAKLRDYAEDELLSLRDETRKDLVNLKIKRGMHDSSEQPLRIRTLRREIARIETIIRERGAGASKK